MTIQTDLLDPNLPRSPWSWVTSTPWTSSTLYRILDTARFAPSGGNMQAWHVIVVKDRGVRAGLRDLSRLGLNEYVAMSQAGNRPFPPTTLAAGPDPATSTWQLPEQRTSRGVQSTISSTYPR